MVMFACELERQRKLDLSAPLMSVRRHQQQQQQQPETPTTTTATSDDDEEQLNEQLEDAWESMRSPGAVPFVWERTPGRPKAVDSGRSSRKHDHHRQLPPPPPGRVAAASMSPLHVESSSLFKRLLVVKPPPAAAAAGRAASQLKNREEDDDDDDECDAFSDAKQTEDWTTAATATELELHYDGSGSDSPAARDFIMRRFLPAAKAMAEESSSATPFRRSKNSDDDGDRAATSKQVAAATTATMTLLPPRSPSVERIQAWQYKFSSTTRGGRRRSRRRQHNDNDNDNDSGSRSGSGCDFSAMRACGLFSMGLLRRRLPASRLRRSDPSSGGEVKQHQSPPLSSSPSPSPRRSVKATEAFYDCETSFAARIFSPQRSTASPYNTPGTNNTYVVEDSRGFLGLPGNYKPPEDPYRKARRSPLVHNVNKNAGGSFTTTEQQSSKVGDGASQDVVVSVNKEEQQQPASLLLPPKSPSQPWLWKAVPPPPQPSTKWEAAVKSRQLRPGHLRYSEEDALQPCDY